MLTAVNTHIYTGSNVADVGLTGGAKLCGHTLHMCVCVKWGVGLDVTVEQCMFVCGYSGQTWLDFERASRIWLSWLCVCVLLAHVHTNWSCCTHTCACLHPCVCICLAVVVGMQQISLSLINLLLCNKPIPSHLL